MIERVRRHGPWVLGLQGRAYGVIGKTLWIPRNPGDDVLNVRQEHLAILTGGIVPSTNREKLIHALLAHENVHSQRQPDHWVWWYQLRYIFSRRFRLAEEKLAYAVEIEVLRQYEIPIDKEKVAALMSGPLYRNMVTFDEALQWVNEICRTKRLPTVRPVQKECQR